MSCKWNLPITYEPKIQPVVDGTCRQTIRAVRTDKQKKKVGDLVRFYVWLGKPYHSKRKTITEYIPLNYVDDITVSSFGLNNLSPWGSHWCFDLALLDGIFPPTGEALRDVLMSKNKIPEEGLKAQILRW